MRRCGSKSRSATREMHEQAERGLAAHWAYKEGKPAADVQSRWIDDLVEILDHAATPEELLEHTRHGDVPGPHLRLHPQGRADPAAQGRDPGRLRLCGPHRPWRPHRRRQGQRPASCRCARSLDNGDQVEILASEAQHPQPSWLRFVVTGKARAGVRRFVRHKERDETVELGRKIYDEIVERLPAELGKDALKRALKKLKIEDEDELMIAIARKRVSDEQVMEALMPGSAGGDVAARPLAQRTAISIKGLTAGRRLSPRRNAATRSRATASSACAARTRRSRSTSSAATRWPAASTPTGSTSPGAKARTAARRGCRSSCATSPARSAPCPASSAPSTPTSSTCTLVHRDGSFHDLPPRRRGARPRAPSRDHRRAARSRPVSSVERI